MLFRGMRLFACCAVLAAAQMGASWAVDFSAELAGKSPDGKTVIGKTYISGQKRREEMGAGAGRRITITRADKGLMWVLLPAKKQYAEMRGHFRAGFDLRALTSRPGVTLASTERVSGYVCRKFIQTGKGRAGKSQTVTVWYSDRLQHPVKLETRTALGVGMVQMQNIQEGKPAESLFELPRGYKKVVPKPQPTPRRK